MLLKKVSTVYYLIGIPGSGKSTWAAKKGLPVFSSDSLREELVGDATNQTSIAPRELFRIIDERVTEKLDSGEDFIFDATNVEKRFREERTISWKQNFKANIIGVMFLVSKEVALKRNSSRERQVDEKVVEMMWNKSVAEPVDTRKEWFDKVIGVDEDGKEQELYSFEKEKPMDKRREVRLSPQEFTPILPNHNRHPL